MRIFSGIRPTGDIHIGNYIGAIKQWIDLQKSNECIFCIVDLHAITTPYSPKELQKKIFSQVVTYLALGLNPERCILFVQSHVKEHSELTWLLGTITPMGDLKRMTQYKEKAKKHKEYINAGLFYYPVLMAADILLYDTEIVPVGDDQKQHTELARSVARKFNSQFGKTFKIPEPKLQKDGARIMSLQDPRSKMSKTDSDQGCIAVFEKPESIRKKIMKAVTDTGKIIKYDSVRKPGISNLLTIYSAFRDISINEAEKEMKGKSYAEFKAIVADTLVEHLQPLREKKNELSSREVYIQEILKQGAKKAKTIAESKISEVYKKMGLKR